MIGKSVVYRNVVIALSFSIPLFVLAAIWFSELRHYHVRANPIDDSAIAAFRLQPDDTVLRELNGYENGITSKLSPRDVLGVADRILGGELLLPGTAPIPIPLPFDRKQFQQGLPGQQLTMAALTGPRLLLEAYQVSGNESYFRAAIEILQAWWAFEEESWLPVGFLWDDHATAARIQVYVNFWSVYRHRADYDIDTARALLASVDRNCQILARPSHFTFATNHGAMQNLALFHAAVAFPNRPGAPEQVETALARLSDQMRFYITDEGIATEHSLGYQDMALNVTATALRYLTLLGHAIPENWKEKQDRALGFLARIRAPDGTMPMYGDTGDTPTPTPMIAMPESGGFALRPAPPALMRPPGEYWFSPTAGYAVWWNGLDQWPDSRALRQTVIAWPNFISHTHKHADEMSVLFWADGQHWWDNIGYWPYGIAPRERAVSWDGSNAPHLENEGFKDERVTRMMRHGDAGSLRLLDLERTRPDGYRARRQVVAIGSDRWFVIDHVADSAKRDSAHNWTTRPDVVVQSTGAGSNTFTLKNPAGRTNLHATFSGADGVHIAQYRGSAEPFAGWLVTDRAVKESSAFRVTMPAGTWSLVSWTLDESVTATDQIAPHMARWTSNEQWTAEWRDTRGAWRLVRDGDTVRLESGGAQVPHTLTLAAPPDVSAAAAQLNSAFSALAAKSEKRRDYFAYRVRLTWILVALLLAQELFFAVVRRVARREIPWLRACSIAAWLAIGLWAQFIYFR